MNELVHKLMQGQSSLSLADFTNSFLSLFDEDSFIDPENEDDIHMNWSSVDIKSFIESNYKTLILKQSLGCKCFLGKSEAVFNPDPFDTQHFSKCLELKAKKNVVQFKNLEFDILDSYAPNDQTFYVTSSDNENVDEIYFEFSTSEPVKPLDLSKDGSYSILNEFKEGTGTSISVGTLKTELFVNFLHIRTNENKFNSIDLSKVFTEFPVNEISPFTRYHKNGRTLFKVHKPTFSQKNFNKKKVARWFLTSNLNYGANTMNESFVAKVITDSEVESEYFTFKLNDNLSYELKFAFANARRIPRTEIDKYVSVANSFIDKISSILYVPIPKIDASFWVKNKYTSNTEILKFISILSLEKSDSTELPSIKDLKKLSMKLFPFVTVTRPTEGSKYVFEMIYKRVSEFVNSELVHQYVRKQTGKPSEIIPQIAKYFNISIDAARNYFDVYRDMEITRQHVVRRRTYITHHHISIKMNVVDKYGLVVFLEGLSNKLDYSLLSNLAKFLDTLIVSTGNKKLALLKATKEEEIDELEGRDHDFFDEELNDLLQEVEDGEDADADEDSGSKDDSDSEKDPYSTRYILNKLYSTDPVLFMSKENKYSSSCQRSDARQPIVVSDTDIKYIEKHHPDSINGHLKYGSDKNHQTNYICPRLWCPRTKISITESEYADAGNKCPARKDGKKSYFEQPIEQTAEHDWKGSERYPGFLDPTKHNDGLCMPCCYKNKQYRWNVCAVPELDADADADEQNKTKSNSNYVMDYSRTRTGEKRFSLLPPNLRVFLGPGQMCGNRHNGTGSIGSKTRNCALRKGLSSESKGLHSLLDCIAFLNRSMADDLVNEIVENFSPQDLLSANNGTFIQYFIPAQA